MSVAGRLLPWGPTRLWARLHLLISFKYIKTDKCQPRVRDQTKSPINALFFFAPASMGSPVWRWALLREQALTTSLSLYSIAHQGPTRIWTVGAVINFHLNFGTMYLGTPQYDPF